MPKGKKTAARRVKPARPAPAPASPTKAPVALSAAPVGDLFARVAAILEQARSNVVRAVNSNMVLSWSHYRALMRVAKPAAREFYEREAIAGAWDKRRHDAICES